MERATRLSASLEDYLKAIFHIVAENEVARAKDVAGRLGVTRSSVTVALRALAERDLINYAPYEVVTLTAEGTRISKDVVRRHRTLQDFFIKALSVGSSLAEKAACDMEHALPREILEPLTDFVDFVERCPQCLEEYRHEQANKKGG
jgi:DtxR family Mn-dependent transcriptional regulator